MNDIFCRKKKSLIRFALFRFFAGLMVFISFLLTSCSLVHRPVRRIVSVMDTTCVLTVYGKNAEKACDAAVRELKRVDHFMSSYRQDGPLYNFNTGPGILTNREIVMLISNTLNVSRLSRGAFDVTMKPLLNLWNFSGRKDPVTGIPDSNQVTGALETVGYRLLYISNNVLYKKKPGLGLDLGGAAKGYAVDRAVSVLKKYGIRRALINAGGDIYALGRKPSDKILDFDGSRLWRIGIKNPFPDARSSVLGVLEVSNLAIVTSGNYERYFVYHGKRYHHILDPRTGYPAGNAAGVTVAYTNTFLADAWATALFVSGPDFSKSLLPSLPGLSFLFVAGDGSVFKTGIFTNLKRLQ